MRGGKYPWPTAAERAQAESIRLLRSARTTNDLDKAVGNMGGVLKLKDGSWIAIRYRDCHRGNLWSSAVALDSAGNWFESDYHFCGELSGLRRDLQFREEMARMKELYPDASADLPERSDSHLIELADAPNLTVAHQKLVALGFRTFRP